MAVLHDLIRTYPFATLVTLGSEGLNADHLPTELDAGVAPLGLLRAHVSRANRVWRDHRPDIEALVIYHGPDAYITPSWYPSKQATGKVVPTWNYITVHASGPLRIIEDTATLREHLTRLTDRLEAGRREPWALADAPEHFIERLLGGIVLLEIPVVSLVGQWKLSQNRSPDDQRGVEVGLREMQHPLAEAMARGTRRGRARRADGGGPGDRPT